MTEPDTTEPGRLPILSPGANEDKMRRVELLISVLLRGGVLVSLVLILGGLSLSFINHPRYASSPAELIRLTGPGAPFPRTVPQVVEGMRQLRGRAFIMAGLVVLIATPVLRVAVSIVGFAYQGDKTFVVLTSIVLGLLLLSFLVGKVER